MKWIQWTDQHIGLPGQDTRGVDVRSNARTVVRWLEELSFDQLVLTGDICYDIGREEVYRWLADLLDPWRDRIRAIPGNHDDPELLMEYFPPPDQSISRPYYKETVEGLSVYYLNSAPALLSEDQWKWFKTRWTAESGVGMVFMHHPPLIAGVPHMDDSHAFHQRRRFQDLIERHDRRCELFCGHYHLERTVTKENLSVHISPTSYFHIDPSRRAFEVDHYRIGLRSIEWTNGQLRTWLDYRDPTPETG